jgi:Protein of unknown function (DUF2752)
MLLLFLNITNWLEEHQLPCMFKSITHFDCPGCGMQRSCIALLKGDIAQSFKLYPALLPMILFFLFLLLNNTLYIRNYVKIMKMGIASIFIIILVSYIYKFTI